VRRLGSQRVDEEILGLFGDGRSVGEIAAEYGVTRQSIYVRLRRFLTTAEISEAGVLFGRRKGRPTAERTAQRCAEAVRLYRDEGMNLRQIGERYGVSRERVRQWIVAAGEATKALKSERLPNLELVEPAAKCATCLGTVWADRGKNTIQAANPTCSQECHDLFVVARWYICEEEREKQRRRTARAALKRSERLSPSQKRYFQRLSSGAQIRSHFRLEEPRPGTKARAAFDRVMEKRAQVLGLQATEKPA
jgi:transposase